MSEEKHMEREYKFAADHVDEQDFRYTMLEARPSRFSNFKHQDTFWQRGTHVVRHRIKGDGSMELTVKQRKSQESLVERSEVNLGLAPSATVSDVEVFLGGTGYKPLFTLKKDYIDLFIYDRDGYEMEAALYSVRREDDFSSTKKFLELEIKPIACKEPLLVLGYWRDWLTKQLMLEAPLNLSLFEFYSQQVHTNYKI
jgi:hypothetical protein